MKVQMLKKKQSLNQNIHGEQREVLFEDVTNQQELLLQPLQNLQTMFLLFGHVVRE
jgi:hypothetical protein